MVSDLFDVIRVTETILDDSFPGEQFCIDEFFNPIQVR